MTKAISVQEVKEAQKVLQKVFAENKEAFYEAQEKLNTSKKKLSEFNDRYGRVLHMMNEE